MWVGVAVGSIDDGTVAEIAVWLSAGVGRGVGKEPRTPGSGVVLVPSTCCPVGPELEEDPWTWSAVPEITVLVMSEKYGIASLVTESGELVRGGGLTKAGRGEDLGR